MARSAAKAVPRRASYAIYNSVANHTDGHTRAKVLHEHVTGNGGEGPKKSDGPQNREPAFECTQGRVEVTVRSKERTDGKSARRKRCTDTARNMHDWTCTDRTKTKDFEMDNQRQQTKSMNHLRSRTKPRDTRPNLDLGLS